MAETTNGNVPTPGEVMNGELNKNSEQQDQIQAGANGQPTDQVQGTSVTSDVSQPEKPAESSAMEVSPIEPSGETAPVTGDVAFKGQATQPNTTDAPQTEGEAQKEAAGESDQTKEGKPAEVGEKRVRAEGEEQTANGAATAQGEEAGEEGIEAKKAKVDDAEAGANAEAVAEGDGETQAESTGPKTRGRGRKSSTKTAPKKAAPAVAPPADGKKRGPGRPRKNPVEPAPADSTTTA